MTRTPRRRPPTVGDRLRLGGMAPVMVVGQFALVAGVPVLIALVGALRRVPTGPCAGQPRWSPSAFAVPLTVWLARPDTGAEPLQGHAPRVPGAGRRRVRRTPR
ncbi:hypothetical protein SMICM304S_11119 [Streptomyces microflavus]